MWGDWSPAAFARAGEEKKPVLLSLVTAWSDECAAMDETTYADPRVASLVNERFVAVRVDADRRPDLNERYNLGGWPTTAFLTGGGDVLSGGTYFDVEAMSAALHQIADAYRDRAAEIDARAAAVRGRRDGHERPGNPDVADTNPANYFRALLLSRFDALNGGFDFAPKHPHPHALMFALSMAGEGDSELARVAGDSLHHMRRLWDPEVGGFFRYADTSDWSSAGSGKTLEDNAALLHTYVEAALRLGDAEWLDQSAAIVRWVRGSMSNEALGGFFNAASSGVRDKTMYVDKNAMMIGAFIRAAALFDDIWLRDFALKSLEATVVPAYTPGHGVAHLPGGDETTRDLLTDQVHVASALIWSHAATGQLPYSMLAAEVLQFAIRTMWDDAHGAFRDRVAPDDPVVPFELNCHAACVLDRLGILTGDKSYQDRARTILRSLAPVYRHHDLFGAPYAVAAREVLDRRPPAGLELTPVDWEL
jgi:uncharacterized protein